MLVDGCSKIVHHVLADLVGEERLHDPERARHDRDPDHSCDEQVEEAEVAVRERVVDQLFEQERRDRAQRRREEDQPEDRGEAQLVRPEEPDDPAEVGTPDDGVCGALDRLGRVERT